jgi:hypothetical protein
VTHRTIDVTPELPPATVTAAKATKALAAHYEHLIHTYPPTGGSDRWVAMLWNEADAALLEVVVADDPSYAAEAIRRAIEDELG